MTADDEIDWDKAKKQIARLRGNVRHRDSKMLVGKLKVLTEDKSYEDEVHDLINYISKMKYLRFETSKSWNAYEEKESRKANSNNKRAYEGELDLKAGRKVVVKAYNKARKKLAKKNASVGTRRKESYVDKNGKRRFRYIKLKFNDIGHGEIDDIKEFWGTPSVCCDYALAKYMEEFDLVADYPLLYNYFASGEADWSIKSGR